MCILVKSYCLTNEQTECYKVVIRNLPESQIVTSPFNTFFVWKIGEIYKDEAKEDFVPYEDYKTAPFFPKVGAGCYQITQEPKYKGELTSGVFHSFKTQEGAEKLLFSLLGQMRYTTSGVPSIAKCVIPKGTWVCCGEDSVTGCECYGSKLLKIVKLL